MSGFYDIRLRAETTIDHVLARGTQAYCRGDHLNGLIGVKPEDLFDRRECTTLVLIARLEAALRSERARARAGHWSYSFTKHMGLIRALRAEQATLVAGKLHSLPICSEAKMQGRRRLNTKKRYFEERNSVFKNFNADP